MIQQNLIEKHTTTSEFYNAKLIHDIMYNENNQVVSIFKDYLILDDLTEFLKRSYVKEEWIGRLPKIFKFYSSYANTFPNYAVLPENKYIFKNFNKKQKAVEEVKKRKAILEEKREVVESDKTKAFNSLISEERLFDKKFIEEVKNMTVLKQSKNYNNMKVSSIINSFLQNSSLMVGNNTMNSIINKSHASAFSKMTASSKNIPMEVLSKLENEPDCKFSVQILTQKLHGIRIADQETTKKAVDKIKNKILELQRRRDSSPKLLKKEIQIKKFDK